MPADTQRKLLDTYHARLINLRAMDAELGEFLGPHTRLRLELRYEIERTAQLIEDVKKKSKE